MYDMEFAITCEIQKYNRFRLQVTSAHQIELKEHFCLFFSFVFIC